MKCAYGLTWLAKKLKNETYLTASSCDLKSWLKMTKECDEQSPCIASTVTSDDKGP